MEDNETRALMVLVVELLRDVRHELRLLRFPIPHGYTLAVDAYVRCQITISWLLLDTNGWRCPTRYDVEDITHGRDDGQRLLARPPTAPVYGPW